MSVSAQVVASERGQPETTVEMPSYQKHCRLVLLRGCEQSYPVYSWPLHTLLTIASFWSRELVCWALARDAVQHTAKGLRRTVIHEQLLSCTDEPHVLLRIPVLCLPHL